MEWLPDHFEVTGRGSSAIYLLLTHLKEHGTMMAPANVCYAALYPAIYAGWSLKLCDVDPLTGNITFETFKEAAENQKADAVLLPHMYGQPIQDLNRIIEYCKENRIVTIEDCAAAMASKAEYPLGKTADYSVYSTGYAKNVEVGFGGLIASSKDSLEWVEDLEKKLPLRSEDLDQTETLFSRLYRVLRNSGDGVLDRHIYKAMTDNSRDLFLFRLNENEKRQVLDAIKDAGEIGKRKISLYRKAEELLLQSLSKENRKLIEIYPYTENAVPWRFSFYVPAKLHASFIQESLNRGLPVSDWYPVSSIMVQDDGSYPGAAAAESRIINFPVGDRLINEIIPQMNSILDKVRDDNKNG